MVSTGNDQGNCATGANGQVATCTDGKDNNAEVSCLAGCTKAEGSGSCSVKQ